MELTAQSGSATSDEEDSLTQFVEYMLENSLVFPLGSLNKTAIFSLIAGSHT